MPYTVYQPQQQLIPLAPDLWITEGPLIRMAMGPLRVPFPTRMTVIRLSSGDLFVHSPIEPTPALLQAVATLGRVQHLVSPNAIHYAWIPAWREAFPDAAAWASPGVRRRARSQGIEVHFDADLADSPDPAWADDVDQLIFRGSSVLEEVVFFHRASGTLILTDLIENFEGPRTAPRWRWLLRLAGVLDPNGKAPADLRATFFGRKAIARACRDRMFAWNPDRVILAHGRYFETDGMAELRRAFRWLG